MKGRGGEEETRRKEQPKGRYMVSSWNWRVARLALKQKQRGGMGNPGARVVEAAYHVVSYGTR